MDEVGTEKAMQQSLLLVVAFAVLLAAYLKSRGYTLFYLGYSLYARTPLGKRLFSLQLSQAKKRNSMLRSVVDTPQALVRIVPFMSDNFAYLVICKQTLQAMAIDPADPQAMLRAVEEESAFLKQQVNLTTVACTHYHHDHAGGNQDLLKFLPNLEVIGGNEAVEAKTKQVGNDDLFQIGNVQISVREVPCHTQGHVAFYLPQPAWLFTGDFLFSAGCGKFFEGSARDFCNSAAVLQQGLSSGTLIFPGHEYTKSNLEFALKVDRTPALTSHFQHVNDLLQQGKHSIPTTLRQEQEINLFLRAATPELLTLDLVQRVSRLVDLNPGLQVQCGTDLFEGKKMQVRVDAKEIGVETCEQVVRALRALKDLGPKLQVGNGGGL